MKGRTPLNRSKVIGQLWVDTESFVAPLPYYIEPMVAVKVTWTARGSLVAVSDSEWTETYRNLNERKNKTPNP